MKKYFFIIFISLVSSLLFSNNTFAVNQGCECSLVVSGDGCNINQASVFAFGQVVSIQNLLNNVSFSDCPQASLASTFIDTGQSLSVTEDLCVSVNYNGSNAGYNWSVSCKLTDEAPNFKDPFSTEGSQSLSKESVGCILFKICPSSEVQSGTQSGEAGKYTAPTVIKLQNPLGEGRTDMRVIVGEIIATALGVMGSLALVVFIYGGFMWLTAGGSDEKVKKGSQAMIWAVIGIFIIFSSYAILTLVISGLGAKGLPAPPTPELTGPTGCYCRTINEKGEESKEKSLQLGLPDKEDCEPNKTFADLKVTDCVWNQSVSQ